VYDLNVKEAEDPVLRLNGQVVATSPVTGFIATERPDSFDVYTRQGEKIIRVQNRLDSVCMPIAFGNSGKDLNYVDKDGAFMTWNIATRKLTHAFLLHNSARKQHKAQLEKAIDDRVRGSILDSSARDETVKIAKLDVVRGLLKSGSEHFVGVDSPANSSFVRNLKFDRSGRFLIGSYPDSPFNSHKELHQGLRFVVDQPRRLDEIHVPEVLRIANWTCDSKGECIAFVDNDFHGEDEWPTRTGVVSIYRNGVTSTAEIPNTYSMAEPIFVRQDRFVIAWGNMQKEPHQYRNLTSFISITDAGDTRAHVVHEFPPGLLAVAVSPDEKWLALSSIDTTIQIRSLESLLPR
jgi:WD40 repeat protein